MPRYTGELRIRYVGDVQLAQKYRPHARAVMGILQSTLAAGVTTGVIERIVAEGVKVRAELFDGMPIATIDVTALEEARARKLLPGIVTIPHGLAYPDGVDPDDPEAILLPVRDSEVTAWATLWHDDELPVWPATPLPRGQFSPVFPEGVHHGGEVDWRGPRGERLSWYGPQSRYWFDPAEQDINAFPIPYLFHMGIIWLFTTFNAAEQEDPLIDGGIMGAAIYRREDGTVFLHTIQKIGTTVRLIRYLLTDDIAATGNTTAKITTHSILWTQSMPDSRCPFFFNQSGDAVVHMTDPYNESYSWPTEEFPGDTPPESCQLWRLTIDPDGSVSQSVETISYVTRGEGFTSDPPTPAIVAVDFRDDVEVNIKLIRMAGNPFVLGDDRRGFNVPPEFFAPVVLDQTPESCGALEIDGLFFSLQYNTRNISHYTWDKIIHADLRTGTVVSLRSYIAEVVPVIDPTRRTEVCIYRDGVKLAGFAGENEVLVSAGLNFVQWEPPYLQGVPEGTTVSPRLVASGPFYLDLFGPFGPSVIPRGFLATCSYGNSYWPSIFFDAQFARFDINGRFWSFALTQEADRTVTSGASYFGRPDSVPGAAGSCNFMTRGTLGGRTGVTDTPSPFYGELGSATYYPMFSLGAPIF